MTTRSLKVGDTLVLEAVLFDREASLPKRVFVDIRNTDNTLREPRFEIFHTAEGRFLDITRTMPDVVEFAAFYYVYEADGTTQDNSYGVGEDVFLKDVTGTIVETNLDAKVSSVSGGSSGQDNIEGSVNEGENLIGTMEDSDIEGEISEGNILAGELNEC